MLGPFRSLSGYQWPLQKSLKTNGFCLFFVIGEPREGPKMAQDGPGCARIAPGWPREGPMALEGAEINLNFMLGPPKMGPGAENKVCQANYSHFYEGFGGPQKYARRAQMALSTPNHVRPTRGERSARRCAAPGCPGGGPSQKIRGIQDWFCEI